jgi:hypothetical protein
MGSKPAATIYHLLMVFIVCRPSSAWWIDQAAKKSADHQCDKKKPPIVGTGGR